MALVSILPEILNKKKPVKPFSKGEFYRFFYYWKPFFLVERVDIVGQNRKGSLVISQIIQTAIEQIGSINKTGNQPDQTRFDDMGMSHDKDFFPGVGFAEGS